MSTNIRYCKECNDEIHGRRDKQFCSDHCRATYNNNLSADCTGFMRKVNNTMRKNRSILSHLNPRGKTRIHKSKLVDSGLNFDYYTNSYKTQGGKNIFFCYDQGYQEMKNDYYTLIAKRNLNT